jgi:hypothetical protein
MNPAIDEIRRLKIGGHTFLKMIFCVRIDFLIITVDALFSREAFANRGGDVTVSIDGDSEKMSFILSADNRLKFKTSNHILLIRALNS